MTYALTQTRYRNYQEYLDDERLSPEDDYRLLNTGELIAVPPEDDDNISAAFVLGFSIAQATDAAVVSLIRTGTKEIQVTPVGDRCVNRKPDLLILHPEHREIAKQAVLKGMVPPLFIAEVVSPGNEDSDNYQRDYVWKRQQYQEWRIPEYWIIDRHRGTVTVLVLVDDLYKEAVYREDERIQSTVFPALEVTAAKVLTASV